jgi:transposase InsO family protein
MVKQHGSIMLVVDKLTKAAHFIPIKMSYKEDNIADIYMKEISKLHCVPKAVVSDKDSKFTSNFWKGLFKGFGMNMNFSIAYHSDSDGKIERINQVI